MGHPRGGEGRQDRMSVAGEEVRRQRRRVPLRPRGRSPRDGEQGGSHLFRSSGSGVRPFHGGRRRVCDLRRDHQETQLEGRSPPRARGHRQGADAKIPGDTTNLLLRGDQSKSVLFVVVANQGVKGEYYVTPFPSCLPIFPLAEDTHPTSSKAPTSHGSSSPARVPVQLSAFSSSRTAK